MSNNTIETAFKKLLGSGRAFLTPLGFTDEFWEVLCSPFSVLREYFVNLKLTHFPSTYLNENNITNGEELFELDDTDGLSLSERAANIESQWSSLSGSQTYKQLENILQKRGFAVSVIENIPQDYDFTGGLFFGNGCLATPDGEIDPAVYKNGKHTFIVESENFYDDTEFLGVTETVINNKQAHTTCYYMPRYLLIEDIHEVMTVEDFETLLINQFAS